jgi:arylesterase / paraoxonase
MIATLWTNRPSAIPEFSAFSSFDVKFENVARNCEDGVLDDELGIAYISCDPGRDRWNTVIVCT